MSSWLLFFLCEKHLLKERRERMERRESCYKENSFFQSAQNVRKLGAYYTDVDHCRRIGNLFDFDQAEEICVLEPSIGDGQAVLTVTGEREHCKIFGVELNRDTYMECLQDNPKFTAILNEDFLKGVKISNNKFSLWGIGRRKKAAGAVVPGEDCRVHAKRRIPGTGNPVWGF